MKKYNLSFFLFLLGIIITIFGMVSVGNVNGLFSKILNFFPSVPIVSHLAYVMLFIDLGMYIIHASFLVALILSFRSLRNSPSAIDKSVFGISLVLVMGVLLLWFIDGSYPVLFKAWKLFTY